MSCFRLLQQTNYLCLSYYTLLFQLFLLLITSSSGQIFLFHLRIFFFFFIATGFCSLPNGELHPHGSLWKGAQCPEVCQCSGGEVSCTAVQCPHLVCGHGQILVEKPEGRCCPDCRRDTGLCFFDGLVKQVRVLSAVGLFF